MENDSRRTAVAAVALAATMAVIVAMFLTLKTVDTRRAKVDALPGTTGLAKAHPPLDRVPGEPVRH
jgi:uncharacterized membrane protein